MYASNKFSFPNNEFTQQAQRVLVLSDGKTANEPTAGGQTEQAELRRWLSQARLQPILAETRVEVPTSCTALI